jgi:diaminopimelate decarboxylase
MTDKQLPGSPFVHYKNDSLMLEEVPLTQLISEYGTPLFAYSKAAMIHALNAYERAFKGRRARIHYAMKANSSLGVLRVFAQRNCGFDIVSGGELARVLAAGGKAEQIIFSGVGKTRTEIKAALDAGICCFNAESEAELDVLNEVALECKKVAPISLRVNPNVDAKTHPYISTGLKDNKFGIAHERALETYKRAATLKGLKIKGIDCHIGSQIIEISPYEDAVSLVLDLVDDIEKAGIHIEHLDFGGGLGIDYAGETPPAADALWAKLFALLDARGYADRDIFVEPGRSLIGNAGVCLTKIEYLKTGDHKNFCIVDAAMNDLPRPAMYEAFHAIVPLQTNSRQTANTSNVLYDVVGPVCESGDWLGKDRSLNVRVGDGLAILSAGAYCMSMSSNYNSRGRAAEVLIDQNVTTLIRRRETIEDLIRQET